MAVTVHPQLSIGEEIVWTNFQDSNNNNIADGWDGSTDFASGEYSRDVGSGIQDQTINSNVTHGGDVSIFRRHKATKDNVYVATATCRVTPGLSDFRARLKLNSWDVGAGQQIQEWFVDSTSTVYAVITKSTTPFPGGGAPTPSSMAVTIAFRAHAHMGPAAGTALLSRISLKRTA